MVGILAGLITIFGFLFNVWDHFNFGVGEVNDEAINAATPVAVELPNAQILPTPAIDPTVTPRPTVALSLDQMMVAAEMGTTSDGQNRAMREIAEIAVKRRNYEKAIEAGTRSATYSQEAETLDFVARSGIKDGEYGHALAAVAAITLDEDHDDARLEIFCAIRNAFPSALPSLRVQEWTNSVRFPIVEELLQYAASSGTYRGQGDALRKAAEIAIILGKRSQAIEAGKLTVLDDPAVETLSFVARSFIEEAQFEFALEAANAIPTYSHRDLMKVEVLAAINANSHKPFSAFADPVAPSCR